MKVLTMRKSKNRYANTQPAKKDKIYHEPELLNSRILMAVKDYIDYDEKKQGMEALERVFRDYKNKKEDVKRAVIFTMEFLLKGRYKKSSVDPTYRCRSPKPTKAVIEDTKSQINQVARIVWSA